MLNLNRWGIFATVAELKSFSKAAERLKMSRPTISKQIMALEEVLGTKLFLRSTRHLQLSETGEVLYQHCAVIMREYYNAEDLLIAMLEKPCGELHISAPISYIQKLLTPLSIQFVERYPEIKLNFHSHQVAGEYFPKHVDIAIIVHKLKDSNLCYRKLGECGHMLCATPSYIKKHGQPQTPGELSSFNFIQSNYAHISPSIEWGVTRDNHFEKVEVTGNITVDDALTVKNMVLNDAGITSLPSFVIHDEINNGELIQLLPDYQLARFPFYAVFPERKYMPPKLRAYINFLVEFFDDYPLLG